MTAILLQCALAAAQDACFASEASKIHQYHQATHATNNAQNGNDPTPRDALIGCPSCYGNILDLYKARYFSNPPADLLKDPSLSHHGEWFTSAPPSFLDKLADLIDQAKQYKIHPRLIDEHVRKQKERWYAGNLTILRSMVEDEDRAAIGKKLRDFTAGSGSIEDLMTVVSASLKKLTGNEKLPVAGLPERLLAATNHDERVEVLREALFMASSPSTEGGQSGEVPEAHKKLLNMLSQDNASIEQVKDRILEERLHAPIIQDQIEKVKTRLAELRRAQSAYALEKAKKAENKKRLAEQQKSVVPDELYNLPPCSVCCSPVNPGDFKVCTFCILLVGYEVVGATKTVYCSPECLRGGYPTHLKTHHCSSGSSCIHAIKNPSPQQSLNNHAQHNHDVEMRDALPIPDDLRFCKQCLVNLKKPTAWCSPACAHAHYSQHHEKVHVKAANGSDQMHVNGHPKDVNLDSATIPLADLVKDWETRNGGVRLEE